MRRALSRRPYCAHKCKKVRVRTCREYRDVSKRDNASNRGIMEKSRRCDLSDFFTDGGRSNSATGEYRRRARGTARTVSALAGEK